MAGIFPDVAGIQSEFPADKAKTFIGDGSGVLLMPGCQSVERVFLGSMEMPQYEAMKFPADASEHPQLVTQEVPLWQLTPGPEGPVLLRSFYSNHGEWQPGAKITVVGEWEAETPPAPSLETGEKKDDDGDKEPPKP